MTMRPHDMTDLYLSPVALEIDQRLEALAGKTIEELDVQVALATNAVPADAGSRASLMLESLTHLLPLHGWKVAWDRRGLRLSHLEHELVLGVPDSVRQYVAP